MCAYKYRFVRRAVFLVLSILLLYYYSSFISTDEADVLEERPPPSVRYKNTSNGSVVVFVFHTYHDILLKLQLYLVRKLAVNLVAIEVFIDGNETKEMRHVASLFGAQVHVFPANLQPKSAGPSVRNTNVINWAVANIARGFLANGTAVLLLDGDVLPLSPFNSETLLNSRDIVCRKYPGTISRYCWMGFICLAPQMLDTLHDFNVSPFTRRGQTYDSGGQTLAYLLKYPEAPFSWMKETILLDTDKTLFWGAVDVDIRWIQDHFNRCDKCGPEVFFTAEDVGGVIFYHMISATSDWRHSNQQQRRQALYDSFMQSPYGISSQLLMSELKESVRKIQKMNMVPLNGNLTCSSVC